MKYAEVIYETGSHSVLSYDDEAELKSALQAHHDRATSGQPGGPSGQPAERITKVLLYDKHPADYNAEMTLSADVAKAEFEKALKDATDENGVVNVMELAAAVRDIANPHDDAAIEESRQNSMYKAQEDSEFNWSES